MTLADVLAALAGLAIAGAGFGSLSLILSLLAPGVVDRAADRFASRPGRSMGIGLLLLLAVLTITGVFLKAPFALAKLAALGTLLSGLSLAVLGGAGIASTLARRLRGAAPGDLSIRQMLRGVFLLEFAALFPIVGWLVVLPASLVAAIGAGFHALVHQRVPAPVAAPAARG